MIYDLHESVLRLARCCEGVFLHQGKNSAIIHFSCVVCFSDLLVLLSMSVLSSFLRINQIVDITTSKFPTIYLIDLLCFCFFVFFPNDGLSCIDIFFEPEIESSREQLPINIQCLESTPDVLSEVIW